MDRLQALHQFWSGFGWKAYNSRSIEDNPQLPYLTHEASTSDFGNEVAQTASLWERATRWTDLNAKVDEISEAIGKGHFIHYDGGAILIRKATPWSQDMNDPEDDTVLGKVLNYTLEYIE